MIVVVFVNDNGNEIDGDGSLRKQRQSSSKSCKVCM